MLILSFSNPFHKPPILQPKEEDNGASTSGQSSSGSEDEGYEHLSRLAQEYLYDDDDSEEEASARKTRKTKRLRTNGN